MLEKREKQKAQQTESENLELKFEKERQFQEEMHPKQHQMWEGKLDAELELAQRNWTDGEQRLRYNSEINKT